LFETTKKSIFNFKVFCSDILIISEIFRPFRRRNGSALQVYAPLAQFWAYISPWLKPPPQQ